MRTTLSLDDDLAAAVRDAARQTGKSFTQVVNAAIRAGLEAGGWVPRAKRYPLRPASLGGVVAGYGLDKALALADTIEDQEIARKLELRK